MLSLYYVYMRPSYFTPLHPYEKPMDSKTIISTWEDFLKDCGGEVIVENYVHARKIFNDKFENNIINWTGVYADTKQAQQFPFFQSDHAMNVLVKMQPSESAMYPDLVLSISSNLLKQKKTVFDSLQKGDEIRFRAKLMNLGNEFKMHHLHAIDIEKTGGFKQLSEILIRESALP